MDIKKGEHTDKKTEKAWSQIDSLQYLIYAEKKHALLVIFQALDAGGKDGTIRHVMSGINPQGCVVRPSSGRRPRSWRTIFFGAFITVVPECGNIGVFNRSHYEDVLVVRVHNLVPKEDWSARYDQINAFEQMLSENGVKVVKFFLHISKYEQKKRFEAAN